MSTCGQWGRGKAGYFPKLPTDRLPSKIHDLDQTAISLGFYCDHQRTGHYFIYRKFTVADNSQEIRSKYVTFLIDYGNLFCLFVKVDSINNFM